MLVTLWEGLKIMRENSLSIAPLCPLCLRYYVELESLDMGRNRGRHCFTDEDREGLHTKGLGQGSYLAGTLHRKQGWLHVINMDVTAGAPLTEQPSQC